MPLSTDDAAHLLRRVGFAGLDAEIDHFAGREAADAVDEILALTPTLPGPPRIRPDPQHLAGHPHLPALVDATHDRRQLGRPHRRHPEPARREAHPVLAQPLRDRRPEGRGPAGHVRPATHPASRRHGVLRRPPPRRLHRRRDPVVSRQPPQHRRLAPGELRPRADGALHHRAPATSPNATSSR